MYGRGGRFTRIAASVLAFVPFATVWAQDSSPSPTSSRQILEQQIVAGLATGADVQALLEQLQTLHKTGQAARPPVSNDTAELDARLRTLQSLLRPVVRRGRLANADVATLSPAYDAVLASHLLLSARFDIVAGRLDKLGAGSAYEQRRTRAAQTYAKAMGAVMDPLDASLGALQRTKDQKRLLADAAFQKTATANLKTALAALDARLKASPVTILRAGLAYRPQKLAQRAPVLTPAIHPSYDNGTDTPSTLDDLADSIDAPLSPEILQQAKDLGYDYVRIYEFVRNTIRTEWYAGGMKGAVGTLRQKAGNDVDQASLLVALFRASNLPARYVHGVVELPVEDVAGSLGLPDPSQAPAALTRAGVAYKSVIRGGKVAAVQVEHTWVTAHVPYTNYRGAVVDVSGKVWLPLAPALKRHDVVAATGILRQAGIEVAQTISDYLGEVQNADLLSQLRERIRAYLAQSRPQETYEQQLGDRTIVEERIGLIPSTLSVTVVAVTRESAQLADAYRQRARIVLRRGAADNDAALIDFTLPLAQIASARVTLSYIPATVSDHETVNRFGGLDAVPPYLIELRPQIKINGVQKAVGQEPIAVGVMHKFELHVLGPFGAERIDQRVISGSYHAIGIGTQRVAQISADDPADTEYQAAKLLSQRAYGYIDAWDQAESELAGLLGVVVVRPLPAVAIASNSMRVDSVLGQVQQLTWQGVTLDAALRVAEPFAASGDKAVAVDWMRLSGLQGSSLEHLLFERDFLVESVSADKGLVLARAASIPIVSVTAGNVATILPTLNHPADVKADIQNWARLGYTIEVPQELITHKQWRGSVWRVEDPATGASGYYLAGGLAGGSTAEGPGFWVLQWLADALQSPNSAPYNTDPLSGVEIVKLGSGDGQTGEVDEVLENALGVMVRDGQGLPVLGAPVTFGTPGTGKFLAQVGEPPDVTQVEVEGAVTVLTNQLGIAQVEFKPAKSTDEYPTYLMRNPGDEFATRAGLAVIEASAPSYYGLLMVSEPFLAIAYPREAHKLQRTDFGFSDGMAGTWADSANVQVQDEFDNPISNMEVTFAAAGVTRAECDPPGPTLPPAVFDNSVNGPMGGFSDCPANPLLGDCGAPSRIAKTSVYGAHTGLILGLGFSSYQLQVSSVGLAPLTYIYPATDACRSSESAMAQTSFSSDEHGRNINAAKIGEAFKAPLTFTLLVGSGKDGWRRANAQEVVLTTSNGGFASGPYNTGVGVYQTYVTTGPAAGANIVNFVATRIDAQDRWPVVGSLPAVYGIDAKIERIESDGEDPSTIYLNEEGQSASYADIHYSVQPANYSSLMTNVDLLKEDVWQGFWEGTTRSGPGKVTVLRGAQFELEKQYEVQLVLNRGSISEIKSDKFKLPLRQTIFKNVDHSVHIKRDVDFLNQRACTKGTDFTFTLTQPARVTLTFTSDGSGSWKRTILNGETLGKGDHRISILQNLTPGDYTFELSGVSDIDGHSETEQGVAKYEFEGHNRLPVGHVLVKGVDLQDGHVSVGTQDFAIPGRGVPLEFRRSYSSNAGGEPGPLGVGWTHNWDSKVVITACAEVIVIGGEGSGMRFVDDGNNGLRPLKGYHGTLIPNHTDRTFDFYGKDGTRYHYKLMGFGAEWNLEFIEDTNGNVTKLGYDPTYKKSAKLITVQDGPGRAINFEYTERVIGQTAEGFNLESVPILDKVTGPDGISVTFAYDDRLNLLKAEREGGAKVESYGYGVYSHEDKSQQMFMSWNKLTSYTDPNGNKTTYSYNTDMMTMPIPGGVMLMSPFALAQSVTEPESGSTRFAYDFRGADGSVVTVTNPRSHATTYTLNMYGSPLSIRDPAGTTHMTWATDDVLMLSKTDANSVRTDYTYDADGNILTEKIADYTTAYTYEKFTGRPIKNRIKTKTDRNGNVTAYTYDARGNAIEIKDAEGGITKHAYATNGDRLQTRDPNGNTTHFGYDAYGNVASVKDALGGETTTQWDLRSRPTRIVNPRGLTTENTYDTLGRLLEQRLLGGSALLSGKSFTYDAVGNKLTETDGENRTTTWVYDRESRVKEIHDALTNAKRITYDGAGNKVSETDWKNNLTSYEYDAANRLITRTEPLNKVTRFTYDAVGNVLSETDANEHTTEYGYDELNRRTRQTDALNGVTEYTYDGAGNKKTEKDALQHVTTYDYDKLDRLTKKTEPLGRVTAYAYDKNGNRTSETDANGHTRTFIYDALNRVIKATDPEGNTVTNEYDAVGNLVRTINARLYVTRHEYDLLNRRTRTVDAVNAISEYGYDRVGNVISEEWPNGNTVTHVYDALNRLRSSTDSLGRAAAYEYDANGNRTRETDANGNLTTRTYDQLNRLTQVDMPEQRTVKYEYDLVGNKKKETDPENNTTSFGYDELNRLVTITDPNAKTVVYTYDAVGNKKTEKDKRANVTAFDYDDLDRLIKITDPLTQTVEYTYDPVGNKKTEKDKRGTVTSFTYDKNNRLLTTEKAGVVLVRAEYDAAGNKIFETDANGNRTGFDYDEVDRLIQVNGTLAAITKYTYDAIGNRIKEEDPEHRFTSHTYDARKRLLTTTDAAGKTTTYTYDGNGNRLTATRPEGNGLTYEYDAANRLTQVTNSLNEATRYTYDKNGNRTSQTDGNSHTTSYEYDALNRQIATVYPDGAREDYGYDDNGNRTSLTDAKRQVFTYVYDALNRQTEKQYPLPATPTGDDIQGIVSEYDANGNPTTVTETYNGATGTRITRKTYDVYDRQTSVTDAFGKTIGYTYDANGNRTAVTDPDGKVTRYTFDALNRVASVINAGGVTNYEYDRASLKTKVTYPNGTKADYAYDPVKRIARIRNQQGTSTISVFEYTYDGNGNRLTQVETQGATVETTAYEYDRADRLLKVIYPDKTTTYTYDAASNRKTERTVSQADGTTTVDRRFGYNDRNQVTGITDDVNAAESVTYGYDANGNQTTKTKNGVVTAFVYDVRDQLVAVTENATTLGQFYYDYQGLRVAKQGADGLVRYTYDGKSVLVQTDAAGGTLAKYDYGVDSLLALTHATEGRQFYLFDALGSVVALTRPDGALQAKYQYDAWGNLRSQTGTTWNAFTFTGHEQDEETGLYYFKARFYDPDLGRFLNQDPYLGDINTPPSLHRYLYAYANPTVYIDPDGHIAWLAKMRDSLSDWADRTNDQIGQIQDPSIGERIFGGLAGVGTGLGKAVSGTIGAVNYVANWASMATGGFGNQDWAMEHAKEIESTHDTAKNTWQAVSTEEGRAGIAQQVGGIKDAWLAGDMKAMAQITGFFGELGTGAAVSKITSAGRLGSLVDDVPTPNTRAASHVTAEAADGISTRATAQATQRPSSQMARTDVTPAQAQAPNPVKTEVEALKRIQQANGTDEAKAFHKRINDRGANSTATAERGGLNLFKWGKETTTRAEGWKEGDFMLYLPNQGSAQANWAQNAGRLRESMRQGNPIFDSYRNPITGEQLETVSGSFLRAERYLLESRDWRYNPSTGAYHPPGK